jgi:hypothetical protein
LAIKRKTAPKAAVAGLFPDAMAIDAAIEDIFAIFLPLSVSLT